MCNMYNRQQICLMNRIRQLWVQHVYWTRFFIISTAAALGDLEPVTKRLLQNPSDFANLLTPFLGKEAAAQFKELFTQHLLIAAGQVNATKNGETEKVKIERQKWYKNADEIACFLSSVNNYWDEEKWKDMMYSHLKMTEKEAVLRLQGNYTADINMFDDIENEAYKMADYMFCGIVKLCSR